MQKKILILIPCLLKGGTEMQTLNLVRVLVDAGHKVKTLCYFEYDDSMVARFNKAECKVELLNWNRNISALQFFIQLKRIIKTVSPDIVHVQYLAPGALPIIASKWYGVKKILATVHQPHTISHGKRSKYFLRFSAYLSSRFTVISRSSEESWFGSSSLYDENSPLKEQSKHFTIYNAIDIDKIQNIKKCINIERAKQKIEIPKGAFVFGAVSRLRHEKGIDLLIQAFAKLIISKPDAFLYIVGNGSDESKLKELIRTLNLVDKVIFYGEAIWETAIEQMALMDVVVVPSRFEGFGLTAAEAGVMSIPVIASKVFGLQEVVSDNYSGLLFENEDLDDLYDKMILLSTNNEKYQLLKGNSLKYIKRFEMEVFRKKILSLYSQL